MFKKVPFHCDIEGSPQFTVTKVRQKTNGDSLDSVVVCDFSENFNDYPRELLSENFSLDAQLQSGLSLKEVNSVIFHDSELNDAELEKIESVITEDVELKNDD